MVPTRSWSGHEMTTMTACEMQGGYSTSPEPTDSWWKRERSTNGRGAEEVTRFNEVCDWFDPTLAVEILLPLLRGAVSQLGRWQTRVRVERSHRVG